jgi:HK97 gp10 family phage protein
VDLYVQVKLFAKVQRSQAVVVEEAKAICPVDTGELRDSIIAREIVNDGQRIIGAVVATAGHAAFVEFGTGARGAASAGAGPFSYTMSWPGMVAQPYMRPALDIARGGVLAEFQS